MPSAIRLVHTADLHLGSPFSWFPEQAGRLRTEQFDAFLSLIEFCERERMHLLLIAGDLFDQPEPEPALARRVADALGLLTDTRVFIASGNHDPAGLASPYRTMAWPACVTVFGGEPARVELPGLGAAVYGAGFTSAVATVPIYGPDSPVPLPGSGLVQILLLHGELVSGAAPSAYNPIQAGWLAAAGFDYAALGHRHASGIGGAAYAYSGCLTGRGFDEPGLRGALAVTLRRVPASVSDGDGRPIRVKTEIAFLPPPRPARQFIELSVDIASCETPDEAVACVEAAMSAAGADDWHRHLYRVSLTGELPEGEVAPVDRIAMRLRDSVFHLVLRDRTTVLWDLDALASQHSLRGAFVRRMRERMAEAGSREDDPQNRRLEAALRIGLLAARGEVPVDAAD